MLTWPLVLDPRRKLNYFRAAGWEEEWIEAAHKIVREEFDQGYAGIRLENEDDSEESSSVCNCIIISFISDQSSETQSPNVNSANLFHDLLSCSSSAPANKELCTELTQYLSTGPENVKDPLLWWVEMRAVYPRLSRMARNYLCIPGMSPFLT